MIKRVWLSAPKGQQDSAQGFNPGLKVFMQYALKGHDQKCGLRCDDANLYAPIVAHLSGRTDFGTTNPGLKPRAESCSPFGGLVNRVANPNPAAPWI